MDTDINFQPQTPRHLRPLSTPDQLAFDELLDAYSNLVQPGWGSFLETNAYQTSSPLNDIPEYRRFREKRIPETWPSLSARALMSKLNPVGPDGTVLGRKDLVGTADERAIAFDLELRNFYDLARTMDWARFYTDEYGLNCTYIESTSPLCCVPKYRSCRSAWRTMAHRGLVISCLKGKLMEVEVCRTGISGESVVGGTVVGGTRHGMDNVLVAGVVHVDKRMLFVDTASP